MYALVGEVIERATSIFWGRVLATRVQEWLNLTHTTVIASEIPRDSVALPYMVLDDKTPVQVGDLELLDGSLLSVLFRRTASQRLGSL